MNKINICVSEKDVIQGYQNITPNQINTLINGSLDEIIFKGLDLMPFDQRNQIIADILSKIKSGGQAIFEFLDIISMAKEMYLGSMSSKAASGLIDGKRSLGYENDLLELIGNFPQFQIKNRYNNGSSIVVTINKEIKNEQ
jgi:hypothetical protein